MSRAPQIKAYQPKAFNPKNWWVAIIFWTKGKKGTVLKDLDGNELLYPTKEKAESAAKLIAEGSKDGIH